MGYVVPVKSKVEISQNIVAFSEYMNFNMAIFDFRKMVTTKMKSNRENDLFTLHCIKVYIYVNFTSLASYALFKCLLRSYLALTCNQFMNRVDMR